MKPADTPESLLAACLADRTSAEHYQRERARITKEAMALDAARDADSIKFTKTIDRMLASGFIKPMTTYRVGQWMITIWEAGSGVSVVMSYVGWTHG